MKHKSVAFAVLVITMLVAGNSIAMMNQSGSWTGSGSGSWMGSGMGGGMGNPGVTLGQGYGMNGAGGMKYGLFMRTINNGNLDVLVPITTPQDAITAIQSFITSAESTLQISAVWDYKTVYKAELSDSTGQRAFDVMVDKLTGVVTPEMGISMMMNASWGHQLQMTPKFGKKLLLTPDEATTAAQEFVSKNVAVINYNLATPETYPGYYKFHTTDTSGNPGVDIMVNGYNGHIWMNSQLGAPISQVYQAP